MQSLAECISLYKSDLIPIGFLTEDVPYFVSAVSTLPDLLLTVYSSLRETSPRQAIFLLGSASKSGL